MATSADLQASLNKFGLGFLFNILMGANIDPNIDVSNIDVLNNLIETNPDTQAAIKQRFKGNEGRIAAGLPALKPSEYIAAEKSYVERLSANGMPVGFYDQPDDLAKLIAGRVSAVEFDNRLQRGYLAAQAAPASVKQQLQDLYGVNDADLAAYFLDPTRATDIVGRKKNADLFSRQLQAAQISAQAQQQANIQLGVTTAEELAAQGVSQAEAQKGYSTIADILPTAEKLSDIYGTTLEGYGQTEAEQEVFNSLASAQRKRQKLTQREIASFSGAAGTNKTSLTTSNVGQY
jgi:antitoxin component HigA of HigAB toxin-antitoxin module